MTRVLTAIAMACLTATVAPAPALAQADCSEAPNQTEASFCARAGWEQSDGELNRIWGRVKAEADRRGRGQALLNAQRAWLTYRDVTCEAESDQYAGGSLAPQVYWSCMDRLTRQRNRELNAF